MAAGPAARRSPDLLDSLLVLTFLIGIYLNLTFYLSPTIPVPTVPAGIAGGLLLLRHVRQIEERHIVALLGVILLYLVSILCAPDLRFLDERFKGWLQLTYSLLIAYGLFITLVQYERNRLARLFILLAAVIALGCALENYAGLREISDAVRVQIHDARGIYRADLRDEILYGIVRPKLFTSEPSAVTFAYTLFGFAWFVLSTWRWKLPVFLALLGIGFFLMRGPTLLLGLALIIPYELFVASREGAEGRARYNMLRIGATILLGLALFAVMALIVTELYPERLGDILAGADPSFFYRVTGPALAALEVVRHHPIAGAGITGEEFIEDVVFQAYASSRFFSVEWQFSQIAEVVTNYLWYHWIYLGLVWGCIMLAALTWLLRSLAAPSLLFCWAVWAIFGQASGGYVTPRVWLVFLLSAALALLHDRQRQALPRPVPLLVPLAARRVEPGLYQAAGRR